MKIILAVLKIVLAVSLSLVMTVIGGGLAILWWDQLSPRARRGEWNIQHYKKIKKGMTRDQLIAILGNPTSVSGPNRYGWTDSVYLYNTHPISSSSMIQVHIDSTAKVSSVFADL